MKRYLREIELSGLILMVIGFILSIAMGYGVGVWPCAVGIVLWLVVFIYRAFHWQEYERENRQGIIILLLAIVLLISQMLLKR